MVKLARKNDLSIAPMDVKTQKIDLLGHYQKINQNKAAFAGAIDI